MSEGQHAAPVSFLERWSQTEPLRLYLYGVTVPVLGVALVYGFVTMEQMGAWLAVAAALFVGSSLAGELARRKVNSPAFHEQELHRQARVGYAYGVEDAIERTPDLVAAETAAMHSVRPSQRCRYIENGNRCVMDPHGKEMPHHYG
jgi:hypothetical protein